MASTIRIKRKLDTGPSSAGGPATLSNAELAFNERTQTLYYGLGSLNGAATNIIAIGGLGAFLDLSSNQTVAGTKTFADNILFNGSGGKKLTVGPLTTFVYNNGSSDVITMNSTGITLASTVALSSTGSVTLSTAAVNMQNATEVTVPSLTSNLIVAGSKKTVNAESLRTYIEDRLTSNTIGSVYSVGVSVPSIMSVANSPVETTGTIAISLNNQDANKVLVGPAAGVGATPTFRLLTTADIPNLSSVYLPLADTGVTTMQGSLTIAGDLIVQGNTTTINTQNLTVEDALIELGKVSSPTNTTANGGGISLEAGVDGDKTITWLSSTDCWTMNQDLNLLSGETYKINNISLFGAYDAGYSAYPLDNVLVDGGTY
jgi:hypothetical protein